MWGFSKGGFYEGGGEISIIGVVRAPDAMINSAFCVLMVKPSIHLTST